MPTATMSPGQERSLYPMGTIINKLKRRGILTDVLVAAATGVSDLIADTYAALRSGTIELYNGGDSSPELNLVRRFEQGIRRMEKKGLLTDVIVAALTTVNSASAATDLRYLVSSVLSDTTLDMTTEASFDNESNFSYATTR